MQQAGERKIAIVTDSTSDISEEQLKEHGINILPLKVVYGDKQYLDRLEIQPEDVYKSLEKEVPKTSMPSPGEAISLYKKLADEGFTDVISIHISSGLSGTYQMVRSVAQQLKDVINIEVIDSKALSWGMGFQVMEAVKMVKNGANFEDVVERVKILTKKIKVYFVVKTLEYLKRGGRIGYVAGTIGEMLNVKPIIAINEEGKYYTYQKVRGRKRSLNRLVDIVKNYAEGKNKVHFAIMHADAFEEAKQVLEKIKQLPNLDVHDFGQIGPAMVVHAGPGLVGIVVYDDY